MWARVIEFMLACWLCVSPFVFRHEPDATYLWYSDLAAGATVAIFALLSYYPPTRHFHFANLLIATWLIFFGRFSGPAPVSAGMQNDIVVGLLLFMFALVPNEATRPPEAWHKHSVQ